MQFLVACIASAAIVLVSPFMGQLQSFLRRSLSTRAYVLLFGAGVLAAVGAAVVFAFARIRERRAERLMLLVAALVIGGGYMWLTRTPFAEVNAVERVHFVEYGLIAFLFYRAFVHRGDARSGTDISAVILPLLLAFMVGTVDEWLQWFIPVRVGEAHDVFLNLAAIVCGLLFGLALIPLEGFSWPPGPRALRRIGVTAAIVWLVFATFVSQVHLGHDNQFDGIGRFRSHYTIDRLIELQKDRLHRWNADPPRTLRRLSREDQYLDEGIWHVRRRNMAQPVEAWHENLILERFYAPVLDIPTYASPNVNRWPIEQRKNMEAVVSGTDGGFVSTAEPYPIVTWRRELFWPIAAAVAILLAVTPMMMRRPRNVERACRPS
jgi:hypothetical protein